MVPVLRSRGGALLVVFFVSACGGQAVVESTPPENNAHSSCDGLRDNCGASADDDCCASPVVAGGEFFRGYDGVTPGHMSQAFPAIVTDFRLDTYQVTVGRFRNFVRAYDAWREAGNPRPGAGAHPLVAGSGWDPAWDGELESDAQALSEALNCNSQYSTWSDEPQDRETSPINCPTWFEAFAFCLWDGGRLATEAEANYAASGGSEQRVYPWGADVPGADTKYAIYGCYFNGGGPTLCSGRANIAPVGSAPAGIGKYGQADLVGNLSSWILDWYADYMVPCDNCAQIASETGPYHTGRILRGGGFLYPNVALSAERTGIDDSGAAYGGWTPAYRDYDTGMRCARAAR